MFTVVQFGAWTGLGLLIGFGATVAQQLLTGKSNTRHRLCGRRANGEMYFSPGRVQLLALTLWAAISYIADASHRVSSGSLPDVPLSTLSLAGASHAVYLGGKAYAMLWKKATSEGADDV